MFHFRLLPMNRVNQPESASFTVCFCLQYFRKIPFFSDIILCFHLRVFDVRHRRFDFHLLSSMINYGFKHCGFGRTAQKDVTGVEKKS